MGTEKTYDHTGLTEDNINGYLTKKYETFNVLVKYHNSLVPNITPLLQNKLGSDRDGDCTLVSFVTVLDYYICKAGRPKMAPEELYEIVRSIAVGYGYTEVKGTNPIHMKSIFDDCLETLMINKTSKNRYLKGIGVSFNLIRKQIDDGVPIVLSLWNDGRKYYHDHTISIVGYTVYKVGDNECRMLEVFDNWDKRTSYLDWDKLGLICSVNH